MKLLRSSSHLICGLILGINSVNAIDLDLGSTDSIKQAAKTLAYGMVTYYTGNRTGDVPGNLPLPYYWWEAGAMFSSLIDYWYYTGDDTYNALVTQAMLHQVGPNNDYMPPNQTKTEGNDDQAFWGMAAMTAAEVNFPNPPSDQPQWLALAQAVFNTQAPRWDNQTCGGGLKWQIFAFNNGYNYKNTISNGCFFSMAARLAKYTGNSTYSAWAEQMFEWEQSVGLMSSDCHFYDGTDDRLNCTQVNHIQWSYNAGVHLIGAATMWNITGADLWKTRTQCIIDGMSVFFADTPPNVMYEVACEPNGKCDVDQRSFKAYLARWMAATIKVAPWTEPLLMPKISESAKYAAMQCSGGADGKQCGLRWTQGATFDGSLGVGEQMSALEIIQANLISKVSGPLTNQTGGTSAGNPNAGSNSNDDPQSFDALTTGDKVGAGFLTTFIMLSLFGGAWWMVA